MVQENEFLSQAQTIGDNLFRDGTYVGLPRGNDSTKFKLRPFFMGYTNILSEGVETGSKTKTIMQPESAQFVLNKGSTR
jgi:hypothetical protein